MFGEVIIKMSEKTGYKHELVMPNADLPFRMFVFEGKDGNYVRDRHWHRSVELFAVFEGGLTFILDEKKVPLKAGEFLIVNSNKVHSIFSPKPNTTIVLQIPLAVFEKYYTDERFVLFSHEPAVEDRRVMELIQKMYETYIGRECGYELLVQSEFYQLIYLMVTQYRVTEVSADMVRNHKKMNRLSTITSYVKENYQKELSLERLAKIFGYSPTYLSKMFQKYAQINYKTYLENIRVEYAYKELVQTDHTITEIAANHGFPNQKAFAKAFQKKYGMLPSEYRKHKE